MWVRKFTREGLINQFLSWFTENSLFSKIYGRVGGREGCRKREKGRMKGIRNKRKGVVKWCERRKEVIGGKEVRINENFGK